MRTADLDRLDADDAAIDTHRNRDRGRAARRWAAAETDPDRAAPRGRPGRPPDGRESFKCGHCRAFVGPTVSGGRHRNHCPLCLTSRHVDDRRPGDRASGCRSLMTPVGTFTRPKGEQVILHRCRGCGVERHNRIAADDHPLVLLRLPLVPPRLGRGTVAAPDVAPDPIEAAAAG